MMTEHPKESVSVATQNHLLFAAMALPLARMTYSGEIDPETVTLDVLQSKLKALGNTCEDAFELHIRHDEEDMSLVAHCISKERARYGVVLLFTLIEGEVNSLIRILMRIRNFSSSAITDALKGTSFDTKLDVLLPLLEARVPDRFRNAALQCRSIRNVVVHNKATPALSFDSGDKASDSELAEVRSARFFSENPIERLQADLNEFIDGGCSEDSSMQWSAHLFEKYFKIPDNSSEV